MFRSLRLSIAAFACIAGNAIIAQGPMPAVPVPVPTCLAYPVPSGTSDVPASSFFAEEHERVWASTHLQGQQAGVKYAPVLWSLDGGLVGDFISYVIVNNPDPSNGLQVEISYFDPAGNLLSTSTPATIAPDGHYVQPAFAVAGPTFGMVRVRVTPTSVVRRFVGATFHHANLMVNPLDSSLPFVTDPLPDRAQGLNSLQQLQIPQRNTRAHLGPIPLRTSIGIDSVNRIFPLLLVCNPHPTLQQTMNVVVSDSTGSTVTSPGVQIPPMGTYVNFDGWLAAIAVVNGTAPERDIIVSCVSNVGLPILGEGLIFDPYGGATLGARLRMTSTMLQHTPTKTLVNPEVTTTPPIGTVQFDTTMSIANVATSDAGPVVIEYFNSTGGIIGSDTIASLPLLSSVVAGRGQPATPNYPNGVFGAWARITACGGGIIGWTNRADEGSITNQTFLKKMYGETLHGSTGAEPGPGFILNGSRRKIAPLAFDQVAIGIDPGYIAMMTDTPGNIGIYSYSFFDAFGTPTGLASFTGLRALNASFTYEDPIITLDAFRHHGAVDITSGRIKGVCTIGGDVTQYFETGGGTYKGPGDTVPF